MTPADGIATGAQIRVGRALLGWRQSDLATAAVLNPKAVAFWEAKATTRGRETWASTRRGADMGVLDVLNPDRTTKVHPSTGANHAK